jgi:hypothetical protein
MHVATDIKADMFAATRNGRAIGVDQVFPDWNVRDRLGIVIREPFGSLGASLLLQVAALCHYEADPRRRDARPQYPQLYAFHVDSRFGDHSSFDIWPPRREVLVGEGAEQLLGAINDRAITRLLVPDAPMHSLEYIADSMSGWSDRTAFEETVTSAWAYGVDGRVEGAEMVVRSDAEELERMATWALTPEDTYRTYRNHTGEQLVAEMQIGPSTPGDLVQWRDHLRSRIDETPQAIRQQLLNGRARSGTSRVQEVRSLSIPQALGLL